MAKSGGVDIYKIYCSQTLFIYAYSNSTTGEYKEFVIDSFRSDYPDLINHLETLSGQIGLNHLKSDYQIIDNLIEMIETYRCIRPSLQLEYIYRRFKYLKTCDPSEIVGEQKFYIPQLDLSKLLGLNTAIRTTTIKDLCDNLGIELSNRSVELFFSDKRCAPATRDEISSYLKSCINATLELYKIATGNTSYPKYNGSNLISARRDISKYFKTRMTLNMSNIKAGEVLACRLYCKANNLELKAFPKSQETFLPMKVSEIVPKFATFNNNSLNKYKDYLNNLTIKPTEDINFNIILNNIKIKVGNGGVHGCIDSGIYKSDKESVIIINDITSFYASTICYMKYYPIHLNESFVSIYKEILDSRFKAIETLPKGHPIISTLKDFLNGIYGKFKEQNSNLYDPSMQLKVIIASQMFTCLWLDMMLLIDGIELIAVNTDGMIYRVGREKKEAVKNILKKLSDSYGFKIKNDYISTLYLKDVNNYMYISESNELHKIGAFDNEFNIYKSPKNREVGEILIDYFINENQDKQYLNEKYSPDALSSAAKIIYPVKESQLSLF